MWGQNVFQRSEVKLLIDRLNEPRRFIQVVMGPRQVGKTTVVNQALDALNVPAACYSADNVAAADGWVSFCWEQARLEMRLNGLSQNILIFDEIQKIPNWSEAVKAEWDRDTREKTNIKVVLLGSSRMWISRGLSESLMGRCEEIRMTHWAYDEMREAFGLTLDEYVYFGGYPGAAGDIRDEDRWRSYIQGAIIDASVNRDILVDTPVAKPALLRRTFELGAQYSGEILSLTKMLGQLQDAGNTTTLTHYLSKLNEAGLLGALQKYAADEARKRASIPKFQVHNNALKTAMKDDAFASVRADPAVWGRYVESAVGAYLMSQSFRLRFDLAYWRDGSDEVDFVIRARGKLIAIEVKSNFEKSSKGLEVFRQKFGADRAFIVGPAGLSLETFLKADISELWR